VDGAESIRPALEQMSLPDFMIDWIIKQASGIDSSTIVGAIAPSITSLALLFIAFLSLFFGSMILFFLLRILARGITSIPVIKQIDKFLGLLFGFLKVALLVYILLFILALAINIPAVNDVIFEFLDKDMQLSTDKFRLSKELYNNN
ncbi:MAG TPA: CvpA family protein, partial [Bacillota bacterium]|nr:CvpA family protein [Bacillota bacterium]